MERISVAGKVLLLVPANDIMGVCQLSRDEQAVLCTYPWTMTEEAVADIGQAERIEILWTPQMLNRWPKKDEQFEETLKGLESNGWAPLIRSHMPPVFSSAESLDGIHATSLVVEEPPALIVRLYTELERFQAFKGIRQDMQRFINNALATLEANQRELDEQARAYHAAHG